MKHGKTFAAVGGCVVASLVVVIACAGPASVPPPPTTPPPSDVPADKLAAADVPHMLRGYCYAGSRVKDDRALGGFGPSENFPWTAPAALKQRPAGIFLHAAPDEVLPAGAGVRGFALYLVNNTGKQEAFHASDSRLSIVREARDPAGVWKPVEYLPRSWCGNSYHRVILPAGECWRFAAPQFKGAAKTKMRFALAIDKGNTVYSNEFDGEVNPGQFTQKQGHRPAGIIDPYNE